MKKLGLTGKRLRHGGCVGGISSEYNIWSGMIARCENPNIKVFPSYGGRGIKVCDRWKDFANFLADMGKKPSGQSLERIDNNGNYEPGNCRWATSHEQSRNRRNNIWVTLPDGTKVILRDYAAMNGINYYCMYARHARGQPLLG